MTSISLESNVSAGRSLVTIIHFFLYPCNESRQTPDFGHSGRAKVVKKWYAREFLQPT